MMNWNNNDENEYLGMSMDRKISKTEESGRNPNKSNKEIKQL